MASQDSGSRALEPYLVGPSYADLIAEALTRFPRRDAFVLGERRLTYAQVTDLVARTQKLLVERGLRPGAGVGVLSPNVPELFVVHAATYLLGARYSGLHPMGSIDDHAFLVEDAEIEVLFVHQNFVVTDIEVVARVYSIRNVIIF